MPVDIRVFGTEQFDDIGKRLKAAGDKQLRRDLYRGLNRAAKPLVADVKEDTPKYLPNRYAAEVAKSLKVASRVGYGRSSAVVYLVGSARTPGKKKRDLASLNRGRLRHPLFGDREHWFNQSVSPEWWSGPLAHGAPRVRREVIEVLEDVSRRLAHG